MAKLEYLIVPTRGKWHVKLNDLVCNQFKNKNDAIKFALNSVKENIENGHDSQLLIQDKDCEWKLKWNFDVNNIFPFNKMAFALNY